MHQDSPSNANGDERVNADEDGDGLHDLDDGAEKERKDPVAEHEVGVGEGDGEDGEQDVGNGEIGEELAEVSGRPFSDDQRHQRHQVQHEGEDGRQRIKHHQVSLEGLRKSIE